MKCTPSRPAFRDRGIAALGLVTLLAPLASVANPLAKPPILNEKTQGIFYVAAKRPYVVVVFGSSAGKPNPTTVKARTPYGKVFAIWHDMRRRAYGDGTVEPYPPTYIVVNSPQRLPVVLKVLSGPPSAKVQNGYPVWINGGRMRRLRPDDKPPYLFETLSLRGGRTVIRLDMAP